VNGTAVSRCRVLRSAFAVAAALAISACAGHRATAPGNAAAARAARLAVSMVGAPYRYGGESPRGFDCSGLVYYTYRRAGIDIPRTTSAQFHAVHRLGSTPLHPGDLLFFNIEAKPRAHVGLYIGGGRFVHAPSSGKRVRISSLNNPYWRRRFYAAGRVRAHTRSVY
jgi:cell wall-associated NlpC family hydrolase